VCDRKTKAYQKNTKGASKMKNTIMKSLNFGVEIEFTGITRSKAANIVSLVLASTSRYLGGTYDAYGTEEFSKFDLDLLCCKADDKIQAELTLLKYHTPQMAAVSADLSVKDANMTITKRLEIIRDGGVVSPDEE
jgi:hypothetical protein